MSKKNTNPIDEALGIDPHDSFDDDLFDIILPDDPNFDSLVKLALEAYKEQMLDIRNMEPKFRARSLEVAQKYLETALNSLSKKDDSRQKDKKLEIEENKTKTRTPPDEGSGKSRESVLESVKVN